MKWPQFSLRFLFAITALIAVVLALTFSGIRAARERHRQSEIDLLEHLIATHGEQMSGVRFTSETKEVFRARLAELKQAK